ncbi:MAG: DUF1553 domain-containing protein [Verrucomicrobiota bacterium]
MPRPSRQLPAWAIALACSLSLLTPAAPKEDQNAFFEKHIRPALITHCYECHSVEADKQKGGLVLDTKAGWQIGGDTGPAIVPGNADESLFVEAIRYHDPDLEMPPDGKMPKSVVARFEQWINDGAHDPRGDAAPSLAKETIDLDEGRQFWSFQPITHPDIPEAKEKNPNKTTHPVDAFIDSELKSKNLSSAPDASPDTILRRLHFTLTGLPPSPKDIKSFRSAFKKHPESSIKNRTDELLDTSAFGERWGRHWLDLTRYADSSGGGRAIPLPDAWRYRDYVIDAFNEDRALNRLIQEHIAGDLLPHKSREEHINNIVGTGFLVLGPHNYENQDKELLDLEIADEQIDTIGRAFLGMTIGCARCHDHKFDPIPTRDYYALTGIFTSTNAITHSNVSKWNTTPLPPTPKEAAALAAHEEKIKSLQNQLKTTKSQLAKHGVGAGGTEKAVLLAALPGIVLDNTDAKLVGEWSDSVHSPRFVADGYLHDERTDKGKKSVTWRPHLKEARTYNIFLSYSSGKQRSAEVPVTVSHANGRSKIIVNQRLTPENDGLFHPLGKFELNAGDNTFIRITTEGTNDGHVIADAVQLIPIGKEKAKDKNPTSPGNKTKPKKSPAVLALEEKQADLTKKLDAAKKAAPKLPVAMAVIESDEPADTSVRIRGETRNFGDTVPRGFLQVTQPGDAQPAPITAGSGRRELAEWIVSPQNPLTARVLANRVWLHLFGEGLVRTPDNFGLTGQAPTHPELLDYLASYLIENNWSTKELIRHIATSKTFRRSSSHLDPAAEKTDPENRLLWRGNRRPVDAETLRDTILTLSGQLDPDRGGPSLPANFKSEFGYKFTSLKRSVYIPVFRNSLYEIFGTFDFANPNFTVGDRAESTIPTQDLFLMNNEFVHSHAAGAAKQLLALDAPNPNAEIRLAWQRTLARDPHPEEFQLVKNYFQDHQHNPQAAWAALYRTLFVSVDFRYIQ